MGLNDHGAAAILQSASVLSVMLSSGNPTVLKNIDLGPDNLGRILFDRARRRLGRGSVRLPCEALGSFVQIAVALSSGLPGPFGVTAPTAASKMTARRTNCGHRAHGGCRRAAGRRI